MTLSGWHKKLRGNHKIYFSQYNYYFQNIPPLFPYFLGYFHFEVRVIKLRSMSGPWEGMKGKRPCLTPIEYRELLSIHLKSRWGDKR